MPVPDNLKTVIIKKGSEAFQNKDGPFDKISRLGDDVKGENRHLSMYMIVYSF